MRTCTAQSYEAMTVYSDDVTAGMIKHIVEWMCEVDAFRSQCWNSFTTCYFLSWFLWVSWNNYEIYFTNNIKKRVYWCVFYAIYFLCQSFKSLIFCVCYRSILSSLCHYSLNILPFFSFSSSSSSCILSYDRSVAFCKVSSPHRAT